MWEYFTLLIEASTTPEKVIAVNDLLKEYGAGDWELVAVTAATSFSAPYEKFYFKRKRYAAA